MSADLSMARIIAGLICPERVGLAVDVSPTPDVSPRTVGVGEGTPSAAAIVRACRRNKVPLLSVDTANERFAALFASEVYRRARAEERTGWRRQRTHYLALQEVFDREGVRAVLIKSAGIAPSLPYASDNLDVLVADGAGPEGRQTLAARQALLGLGYIELKNVEEPHKFLFRKFHAGQTVSAIHLHEFVGWGTGFMDDRQVLEGARPAPDDPALLIPSAEDGLLITMAHAFYEDKAVKLGDLWKVIHLLRGGELNWERVHAQASLRGWAEGLWTCIWLWAELEERLYGQHSFPEPVLLQARQAAPRYSQDFLQRRFVEDTTFPYQVSFAFSKRHYYRKVRADRKPSRRQKGIDALRHTLAGIYHHLPFSSQRPMLVSLSGVDGSGKTAHASALQSAFGDCAIRTVTVWSRGGSSPFTDRVIALVKPFLRGASDGLDTASQTRQAMTLRKQAWMRRPLLRFGWSALVVFDLVLNYWRRVSWPLLRGNVVICDRYIYDALVELAVLGDVPGVTGSWMARALVWLTPRPRLAYLLQVSEEDALARKPGEFRPFIEAQVSTYEQAAARWGLSPLDTGADFASVSDGLVREVLREYYRDWHTLINGLFMTNPLPRE